MKAAAGFCCRSRVCRRTKPGRRFNARYSSLSTAQFAGRYFLPEAGFQVCSTLVRPPLAEFARAALQLGGLQRDQLAEQQSLVVVLRVVRPGQIAVAEIGMIINRTEFFLEL